MKPMNPKPNGSDQGQKWGLFILLAGSLGFTLSMNPDHFNNIARNEYGLSGVFELAQKAAPDKPLTMDKQKTADKEKAKKALSEVIAKLSAEMKKTGMSEDKIKEIIGKVESYEPSKATTGIGALRTALLESGYSDSEATTLIDKLPKTLTSNPILAPNSKVAKKEKAAEKEKENKAADNKAKPEAQQAAAAADTTANAGETHDNNSNQAGTADNQNDNAANNGDDNNDGHSKQMKIGMEEFRKLIRQEVAEAMKTDKLLPQNAQTMNQPAAGNPAPQPAANAPANGNSEAQTPGAANNKPPVPGNPPNQAPAKPYEITMGGEKGFCVISAELENGKAVAKAKSDAQGKACHLSEKKELQSSISDIKGLQAEIVAWFNGKTDDKEEKKEKTKTEIAKEFWEKASKRCKVKGMDAQEKLECYQDNLVKLSNDLDDSPESKNIIRKYFALNLMPALRTMMSDPTTDPFTLQIDTSKLDAANGIALNLLENLNGDNSDSVTTMLSQLKGGSYSAQISHARNMFLSAQEDKKAPDFYTQQLGMRKEMLAKMALNPIMLGQSAVRDMTEWKTALSDKAGQQGSVMGKFYGPVQALLGTLPRLDTYNKLGTNNQNMAALELSQLNIPDISGLNMNAVSGSGLFTPGTGQLASLPAGLLESRVRAQTQYRGYSTPALSTGNNLQPQQNLNNKMGTTPAVSRRGGARQAGVIGTQSF